MNSFRQYKGVTLLEVLVALILFGIAAILVTPSMQYFFAQGRLKSAAEGMYDDVLYARTTALKSTNATTNAVTLVVTNGASWCYGMTTATTCACNTANNCNLGQTTSTNYTGVSITSGGLSTKFDTVRGVPTTTGSIIFTASTGQSITLNINAQGTTTLCSTNTTVGGYAACP